MFQTIFLRYDSYLINGQIITDLYFFVVVLITLNIEFTQVLSNPAFLYTQENNFRSNIENPCSFFVIYVRGVEIRRVDADHVFKDFSGK